MLESTSIKTPENPAIDVPLNDVTNGKGEEDIYQAMADQANAAQQIVIDDSVISVKEQEFLDDIEVEDVFDASIGGMSMNLSRKKDYVIFSINDKIDLPKKVDASRITYTVEMSSKAMKEAQERIQSELNDMTPFDCVFSSLAVPAQIKGFDNKKTMKEFIKYLSKATVKLTSIGDTIQFNLKLIGEANRQAERNVTWLYNRRHEWDDENKSEIASMGVISSQCQAKVILLNSELKDVKNQISSIRIRSSSAGEDLAELIEDHLNDKFDVTKAKIAIKNNNFVAKLNNSHNNAITKLINDQKASDKKAFAEFTDKINNLNDAHAIKMSDLRIKHQEDMDAKDLAFKKQLEDQAVNFAKILDESNKKHKTEIADLHIFYKDKIADVVKGYEKTISDLKIVIQNYSNKLDEANKLISSYYSALDDSQKNQANLLNEYKQLAADRVRKLDAKVSENRITSLDVSDAPTSEDTTLSGSLGLNAALGEQRQAKEKIENEKKAADDLLEKEKQEKIMYIAAGSVGLTILGALAYKFLKTEDEQKEDYNRRKAHRDQVELDDDAKRLRIDSKSKQ